MTVGFAADLVRSAIIQVFFLAGPLLLVGMGVGLIISIFQATTSIQEQTLTFVPKITAIFAVLIFLGEAMLTRLVQFTLMLMEQIPNMIR